MNDQIRCQHCGGFTPIDDELQNLRAENTKLRAALMPFAEIANLDESDDEAQDLYDYERIADACRSAKAAMEGI